MQQALSLLLLFILMNASQSAFANEQGIYQEGIHPVVSQNPEPRQFAGILASHNKVRQRLNQHPLSWSNSLANYAQQWVNRLAETENCKMIYQML